MLQFQISARDGAGRTGVLSLPHGTVRTPAFMPVGTYGTVRGLMPADLVGVGAEMVLANAYHLALRPGSETISKLGGLHRFMGWKRPILTDSGGFQLFSLASSVRVDDRGAVFRSHIDGARFELTPERAVDIQCQLGVDIGMAFDVCAAEPGDRPAVEAAADRTLDWARRTRQAWDETGGLDTQTNFFAILQGGLFEDLRAEQAKRLVEMEFPGYAVGGLSVGEAREQTMQTAEFSTGMLPADKPRYMMGMGTPLDLVDLCGWGYDLFDCVIPTRNARNGTLFTADGPVMIRNAVHRQDQRALEDGCDCTTCTTFSRGYLHHLARRGEMLAAIAGSLHNVRFYQRLMAGIREAIASATYQEFSAAFRQRYTAEVST